MRDFPFRLARLVVGGSLAAATLAAGAADYVIDPAHTYASFEVDHLGFSYQRGRFDRTTGSVQFDAATHSGSVDIRIDAASLNTGFAPRDDVLRGESWFNVRDNPDILFRSQRFVFDDDRPVAVEGTLVLLGQARPMRLEIARLKCGFNLAAAKRGCGVEAQGALRRSEFGMHQGIPFVGDEVRLRIQVEAYQP